MAQRLSRKLGPAWLGPALAMVFFFWTAHRVVTAISRPAANHIRSPFSRMQKSSLVENPSQASSTFALFHFHHHSFQWGIFV